MLRNLFFTLAIILGGLNFSTTSYAQDCTDNSVLFVLVTDLWGEEISWQIADSENNVVAAGEGYASNSAYTEVLCLANGCYTLLMYDSFGDGWNGALATVIFNDQVLAIGNLPTGDFGAVEFGVNNLDCAPIVVLGCTDPSAINFDPEANFDDGSCEYGCDCPDVWAPVCAYNYQLGEYITYANECEATCDNAWIDYEGECGNPVTYGCTDEAALNYNPQATDDDGSCFYESDCESNFVSIYMYDSFGDGWNGSELIITSGDSVVFSSSFFQGDYAEAFTCLEDGCYVLEVSGGTFPSEVSWTMIVAGTVLNGNAPFNGVLNINSDCAAGCTDPEAENYDPNATDDDGSCTYPFECDANTATLVLTTGAWGEEVSWEITDDNNNIIATGSGYSSNSVYTVNVCLEDGCYGFHAIDSFGDGWNGGLATLEVSGGVYTFGLDFGDYAVYGFGVNQTDCEYDILGCTDETALNYNPSATVDDGSCVYPFTCENGIAGTIYTCTFGNGQDVAYDILDENGVVVYSANDLGNNVIMNEDICLEEGMCYTVVMTNLSGNTGWYGGYFWINIAGVQVTTEFLDQDLTDETYTFSIDGTACPYGGCMDPEADNYDENADYDDGSCQYSEPCEENNVFVTLSTQVWGNEISWSVINEWGDVVFAANGFENNNYYDWNICLPSGCYTFVLADSFGDGWNGGIMVVFVDGNAVTLTLDTGNMAEYTIGVGVDGCEGNNDVYGCTDPEALNYNADATVDDGSCEYEVDDCESNSVTLYMFTQAWGTEISWDLTDSEGNVVATGGDYSSWSEYEVNLCLGDGCYSFQMYDTWGDGWNGAYYMFIGENGFIAEGTLLYGNNALDMIGINTTCEVDGCMDEEALNYNPNATIDDGSCVYNNGFAGIDLEDLFGVEILVTLVPNPVVNEFVINVAGLEQDNVVTLRVMNMLGQLIEQTQFTASSENQNIDMNASNWANGTYFVSVVQGSNVKSVPLVIAR
jgi:hypothetical protein